MRWSVTVFFFSLLFLASMPHLVTATSAYAGWRTSPYGLQTEEPSSYWVNVAKQMQATRSGTTASGVWILGEVLGTYCNLTFPSNVSYPSIGFSHSDRSEAYLSAFDSSGLKIWLQVEPGDADVDTLIDLVLGRYKHHSCVMGFGIDIEWYQDTHYTGGKQVTNAEVQTWTDHVKAYSPNYRLFLKHWSIRKMPTIYPRDVVFIDDSNGFSSMSDLVSEFQRWGQHFSPSKVGFQVGYDPIDKKWWSKLNDPPNTLVNTLFDSVSNCESVYWVDFTLLDVFPANTPPPPIPKAAHPNETYPILLVAIATVAIGLMIARKLKR